jgi:anti-sigma28 factor (negative regulator of flagellin synthesis)
LVALKVPAGAADGEYMKVTGRHPAKIAPSKAVASAGTGEIGRASRVKELKRLVATGRYRVSPANLAARILIRALGRE